MMVLRALCGLLFAAALASRGVCGCPAVEAQSKLPLAMTQERVTGNSVSGGIKPGGFVYLSASDPTVPGIDVSKWQDDANFKQAYDCGARFGYVRLSAGEDGDNEELYRVNWAGLRSAGILPGPYHNLTVVSKQAAIFAALPAVQRPGAVSDLAAAVNRSARIQAVLFASRLNEVLDLDPLPDKVTGRNSASFLPVVIDASGDPLPSATIQVKAAFGPIYTAAICTWFHAFRSQRPFSKTPVVLFTSPSVYRDYKFDQSSCGLADADIWIKSLTTNGDRFDRDGNQQAAEMASAMCFRRGRSRCIMQQYTCFGGFAVFKHDAPLDLDRFFGTEAALKARLITR